MLIYLYSYRRNTVAQDQIKGKITLHVAYGHYGDGEFCKLVLTPLDALGVAGREEHIQPHLDSGLALVWPATRGLSDTRQPTGFMTGQLCNVRASGQVTIAQTPIYGFIRSSQQGEKKEARVKWQMSQGGRMALSHCTKQYVNVNILTLPQDNTIYSLLQTPSRYNVRTRGEKKIL